MKCPDCGTPYEKDTKYCPKCGHPLSDADYSPLSEKEAREGKKKYILQIALILCLLIAVSGFLGYRFYIKMVAVRSRQAVDQIFQMAHDLDFSPVDPMYLPDELKENPNIRSLIKEKLNEALEGDHGSNNLTGYILRVLDVDEICDDIVSSASYEILSVEPGLTSCRVTVRTSNTDYSKVADSVYQELMKRMSDEDSLWEAITSFFSSIFGGQETDKEIPDLKQMIREIYEEAKANTDKVTHTGEIVFGIEDRSWTLTEMDQELFYSYYGISSLLNRKE